MSAKKTNKPAPKKPSNRKLQGYAFDPSLSLRVDTAPINNIIYKVTWEEEKDLMPGPVGEYFEVVDYDPTTGKFYEPVNLNHPHLLKGLIDPLPDCEDQGMRIFRWGVAIKCYPGVLRHQEILLFHWIYIP
jgi:hypothetical protein